jgi:hypothetical protein
MRKMTRGLETVATGPGHKMPKKTISRIWQQKHPKMMRLFQKIKYRQRMGIRKTRPQKKKKQKQNPCAKHVVSIPD